MHHQIWIYVWLWWTRWWDCGCGLANQGKCKRNRTIRRNQQKFSSFCVHLWKWIIMTIKLLFVALKSGAPLIDIWCLLGQRKWPFDVTGIFGSAFGVCLCVLIHVHTSNFRGHTDIITLGHFLSRLSSITVQHVMRANRMCHLGALCRPQKKKTHAQQWKTQKRTHTIIPNQYAITFWFCVIFYVMNTQNCWSPSLCCGNSRRRVSDTKRYHRSTDYHVSLWQFKINICHQKTERVFQFNTFALLCVCRERTTHSLFLSDSRTAHRTAGVLTPHTATNTRCPGHSQVSMWRFH